ncbi:hypothetical protein BSL82_14700 [Tardibacter chloracetimidivorans]|jgi:hypothetical protein|uniref:Uncharacterized protein n=1 Tax=Tardibacter chloracetimidivorans TaxID=1921510 RepID=A0A1L3ZXM1_9SPHN|nr:MULTISPECIES: hypothetical protein [Alphaproteobacteria]API60382.1 hypothetical protein BSL82_14700 [Tardibacter chloracetimidivorans]AUC94256.1 hypothetical protein CWS35_08150 [Bradyrhizobium sp. SK17]KKC25941.1 hypothetical protein WP12_11415 [Sphingomonas sp. SRS2]
MQDFIAALVSFFLIEPLQAEMAERLAAAQAPQAVVAELTACARSGAPTLLERATNDPAWAASNAVRLWAGWVRPDQVLVEAAPGCAAAVEAARPFLTEPSS